ncbi:hypothetical protein [Streptomyces sp. NPDC003635]
MEKEEVHWQDIVQLAGKLERVGVFDEEEIRALRLVFDAAGESLVPRPSARPIGTVFIPGDDPDRTRRAFKVFELAARPVETEPPEPDHGWT